MLAALIQRFKAMKESAMNLRENFVAGQGNKPPLSAPNDGFGTGILIRRQPRHDAIHR